MCERIGLEKAWLALKISFTDGWPRKIFFHWYYTIQLMLSRYSKFCPFHQIFRGLYEKANDVVKKVHGLWKCVPEIDSFVWCLWDIWQRWHRLKGPKTSRKLFIILSSVLCEYRAPNQHLIGFKLRSSSNRNKIERKRSAIVVHNHYFYFNCMHLEK